MVPIADLVHRNVPVTFISITLWKSSSLKSNIGTLSAPRAKAALFIKISTRPNSSTVLSTICCTLEASVTSTTRGRHLLPSALTRSDTLSISRQPTAFSSSGNDDGSLPVPVTTTSAPNLANSTAAALPIPRRRPAPVTIATLPSSSPILNPPYINE